MQHFKLLLRRSVPLALICCVLLFILSPSASAAAFSDKHWSDFPFTSTTVDGMVNYSLDFKNGGTYTIRYWSPFQETELGSNPSYVIEKSGTYTMTYFTPVFEYDSLFFTGADSSFSFAYDFYGGYSSLDFTDSYVYVLCYDSSGNYLTTELFEASYDSETDLYTAFFAPRVPSGTAYVQLASALYFRIQLITSENEATPVVFPISTFYYNFSLSVDSVQNQQVQEKLDGINDKLDNAINGEVSPEPPAGSGLIDDLDQAEGALRDEAQSGLNSALDKFQHATDSIYYYGQAFAVVANIFGYLTDLPFFSLLLDISLSLGVLCVILNLGEMATRVSGARARRSGKSKKGG